LASPLLEADDAIDVLDGQMADFVIAEATADVTATPPSARQEHFASDLQ
jgi:hypothetical protein